MIIDGVNYHYRLVGQGDPVVLLHGFTGSSANWSPVIDALSPDHTVLAVDLLGHGDTDSPADPARYRIEQAAADLATLITRLVTPPATLLGYSMGGRLALYTAIHYPHLVNRLILESASPGLEDAAERAARRQSDEALAARIEREGIEAFVHYWERIPLFDSQMPEQRERLRAGRLKNNPTGLANSLRGMGTGAQPPLWDRLGEVDAQTLLIAGELDGKFTAIGRRMAEQIPRADLAIIPNAGHTVHLEQPDIYIKTIADWIKRHA